MYDQKSEVFVLWLVQGKMELPVQVDLRIKHVLRQKYAYEYFVYTARAAHALTILIPSRKRD